MTTDPTTPELELLSQHRSHGGWQRFYRHHSATIGLPMRFAVFVPDAAATGPVPALFYLAGLTCTEETFPIKAGAQRLASQQGIMLVAPDTSPRGAGVQGEGDDWDFGTGAGFYLDATEPAWRDHYRMYSYIVDELHNLAITALGADRERIGIFGHSMGGHGALVLALRNPTKFRSVSAFAPIAAPTQCPWGKKAFTGYLGADASAWAAWDASALMRQGFSRSAFQRIASTALPGAPMVTHCASSVTGTMSAQESRNLSVSLAILFTGAAHAQLKVILQPLSTASTLRSA